MKPSPVTPQQPGSVPDGSDSAAYYERLVTQKAPMPARYWRWMAAMLAALLFLAFGAFAHIRRVRSNEELRIAVLEGDAGAVRHALTWGANPNLRNTNLHRNQELGWQRYLPFIAVREESIAVRKNKTLLMLAAGMGKANVVDALLAGGADPDIRLDTGLTALLAGAGARDPNVTRTLLAHGADIRARDADGRTPLLIAAHNGNVEAAGALLDKGADIEAKDSREQTALCLAAALGHEDAIQLLLARGANLDGLNHAETESPEGQAHGNTWTPQLQVGRNISVLAWVAMQGSPTLISALWQHMDAHSRTEQGPYVLNSAVMSGSVESVRYLLEQGVPVEGSTSPSLALPVKARGEPPLITAARTNKLEICRLLIERGANVNCRGFRRDTPLNASGANGELVRLLLERGAQVNVQDQEGNTPLMMSASPEVTRLLLEHGAEVNARDNKGRNALLRAYNPAVMKLLLEHGADARGDHNDDMLLTRVTSPEVAALLIEHGADVNARDLHGKTPLMKIFFDKITPVLLAHGADVNARDQEGRTALHEAVNTASQERIKALLQHNANVNAVAANGDTPLSLARQRHFQPVLDLLIAAGAK